VPDAFQSAVADGRSNSRIRRRAPKVGRVFRNATSCASMAGGVAGIGDGERGAERAVGRPCCWKRRSHLRTVRGTVVAKSLAVGLDAALSGAFDQPQAMVVGIVFISRTKSK